MPFVAASGWRVTSRAAHIDISIRTDAARPNLNLRRNRSTSEHTTDTPPPTVSIRSRDENRAPDQLQLPSPIRPQQSANFVLLEHQHRQTTNILHLDPLATPRLDITDTLEQQLAPGSLTPPSPHSTTTSQRLATLENLCTRLLAHATTASTIIADLKSRLETAESFITNLTNTLDGTRTQLATANSELSSLRASAATSDQRTTDTTAELKVEVASTKQLVESFGSRLTQAEGSLQRVDRHLPLSNITCWDFAEKWGGSIRDLERRTAEPDDMFLFEPPTHPRSSSRSRSKEPAGFTVSWADHQQALAGGLVPPAVRLFGAGRASSHDADEMDEDRPGTSSSNRTRYGPGGGLIESRSASAHPSSWSSNHSTRRVGLAER